MKNFIMYNVRAFLVLACSVLFTASCINEEYSLKDDNLNLEINAFQKGLILPLGKTDRIEVQDMLADVESGFLTVGDDGAYSIVFDGSYDVDRISGLDGLFSIPDIGFNQSLGFNFNAMARAAGSFEAPVARDYVLDFISAADIPAEIDALGLVEFQDTYADIAVDASVLPAFNGATLDVELNVTFPDWVKIDGADENGVAYMQGRIDNNGMVALKSLKVISADLSNADLSNDVKISLNVEGKVVLTLPSLDATQWVGRDLKMLLDVAIKDINISKLSCKLDYSLDPIVETIDLSDFNSFFDGFASDADLCFNHVDLSMTIASNMGVKANADVRLVPYYDGQADEAKEVRGNIILNASESSAAEAVTNYTFEEAPVLELLRNVPEKIELIADLASDPTKFSIIEPGADYSMNVGYGFDLPLEFGDDFTMIYRDTIPDMPAIVGSLLSRGNKVMLAGEIENSLPLGLDLRLNFLDSDNNVVPVVSGSGVQKISPCGKDGSASKTKVEMLVALKEGVVAEDIVSLELVFAASSKGASGVQVTTDDYLQAVFHLVLPEGLSLDIKDLIENDEQNPEDYE